MHENNSLRPSLARERPVSHSTPDPVPLAEPAAPSVAHRRGPVKKTSFNRQALIGIIGIVLAAGLLWWLFGRGGGLPSYIETSKYQAVFLQTGEFYFGKVQSMTNDTLVLKDVFYVQKATQTDANNKTSTSSNSLELIKLGRTEVHGPEDTMAINRAQVLYVENLKDDGQVVEKIQAYKQQNK